MEPIERRKIMANILPKGESIRQAVKWISNERLQEDKCKDLQKLICDASITFDLSPKEEDFLVSFYKEEKF